VLTGACDLTVRLSVWEQAEDADLTVRFKSPTAGQPHQHQCKTSMMTSADECMAGPQCYRLLTLIGSVSSSSSSLFGMHHQCVAPLAANSPHSSLSRAILIASSKVRLCRDRSFFRVAILAHPGGVGSSNWPSPITLGNGSQNSPGVGWLIHSDQVAKQHESSFLYDRSKERLFGVTALN